MRSGSCGYGLAICRKMNGRASVLIVRIPEVRSNPTQCAYSLIILYKKIVLSSVQVRGWFCAGSGSLPCRFGEGSSLALPPSSGPFSVGQQLDFRPVLSCRVPQSGLFAWNALSDTGKNSAYVAEESIDMRTYEKGGDSYGSAYA